MKGSLNKSSNVKFSLKGGRHLNMKGTLNKKFMRDNILYASRHHNIHHNINDILKNYIMFNLDKSKAINSTLFVIEKLSNNKSEEHRVFKVLYFADKKHLVRYGKPITGDTYIKTDYGAVPSFIRNLCGVNKIIRKEENYLISSYPYDEEELSNSEIECLLESIDENKGISFGELVNKSYDMAWKKSSYCIDHLEMAKDLTNNSEILNYIRANMLNEKLL